MEGNALRDAGVADVPYPLGVHGSRSRPALAAGDNPIDAPKIKGRYRPEQRLKAEELGLGGALSQVLGAPPIGIAFDADTHPNVLRPVNLFPQIPQSLA